MDGWVTQSSVCICIIKTKEVRKEEKIIVFSFCLFSIEYACNTKQNHQPTPSRNSYQAANAIIVGSFTMSGCLTGCLKWFRLVWFVLGWLVCFSQFSCAFFFISCIHLFIHSFIISQSLLLF